MEIWKDVQGAEGSYMISSIGRLKSCARYVVNNVHGGKRFIPEKILSRKKVNSSGYFNTQLNFGGFSISVYLHRLVAEHFIPKIKGKNFVNHKNGIKTDNRVENLEWCNNAENQIHAHLNGLKGNGNLLWNGKFSKDDIEKIKNLKKDGILQYKIAEIMNTTKGTVSEIINGKRYKYT